MYRDISKLWARYPALTALTAALCAGGFFYFYRHIHIIAHSTYEYSYDIFLQAHNAQRSAYKSKSQQQTEEMDSYVLQSNNLVYMRLLAAAAGIVLCTYEVKFRATPLKHGDTRIAEMYDDTAVLLRVSTTAAAVLFSSSIHSSFVFCFSFSRFLLHHRFQV